MRKFFLWFSILCYCTGIAHFYIKLAVDKPLSVNEYFQWSKMSEVGVLGWLTLYFMGTKKEKKPILKVVIFSVLRLLWEVISDNTSIYVNNKVAVIFLYAIIFIWIGVLLIFDLAGDILDKILFEKRRKENEKEIHR